MNKLANLVCSALVTESKRTRIVCLKFTSLLLLHSPISMNASFSMTIFHDNLLSIILDDHDEVSELVIKILLQYSRQLDTMQTVLQEILMVGFVEFVYLLDLDKKRPDFGKERSIPHLLPLSIREARSDLYSDY